MTVGYHVRGSAADNNALGTARASHKLMDIDHAHNDLQIRIGVSRIDFNRRSPACHAHVTHGRSQGVMGNHAAASEIFGKDTGKLGTVGTGMQPPAHDDAHPFMRKIGIRPENLL